MKKIPYMLVVGAKEEEEEKVAVRSRSLGDEGQKGLEEFISQIQEEIHTKAIQSAVKEEKNKTGTDIFGGQTMEITLRELSIVMNNLALVFGRGPFFSPKKYSHRMRTYRPLHQNGFDKNRMYLSLHR